MDIEGKIHDPLFPLNLLDLCFDFYRSYMNKEDPFRVIVLGLYYLVGPVVYPFPDFMSWLMARYVKEKNNCISSTGEKILEVAPELIQNTFVYLKSPNLEKFMETKIFYDYNGLSTMKK